MMKILNNRFVKFLCLCLMVFSCFKVKSYADSNLYCRECGKKISSDSKFCMYCGTKVTVEEEPEQDRISFSRSERTVKDSFKNTATSYNVFPYEINDCCGCSFKYTANSNNSGTACTGMRDVYVRSRNGEEKHDDNSWIYVGSFEYPHDGETVTVDLRWQKTRVYAVAVIRHNLNSNCSFSASWGEMVTFYVEESDVSQESEPSGNTDRHSSDAETDDREMEMVECSHCNGTGICQRCYGIGHNPCLSYHCNNGRCSKCGGSGTASNGKRCITCGGDGICNSCYGSGGSDCNMCGGDGDCPFCDGWKYVLGYED